MNAARQVLESIMRKTRSILRSPAMGKFSALREAALGQIEAYSSLMSFLQPRAPLPPMHKGAIRPDLGVLLASKILNSTTPLIFETGSGVSTLIAGYCLEKIGHGTIFSLEHNPRYAQQATRLVQLHG